MFCADYESGLKVPASETSWEIKLKLQMIHSPENPPATVWRVCSENKRFEIGSEPVSSREWRALVCYENTAAVSHLACGLFGVTSVLEPVDHNEQN